jgi:hypothetical protein
VARSPDTVPTTYELRGADARAAAAWFVVTLELSQSAEHRARPDRDAALRSPDGATLDRIDTYGSTNHTVVEWMVAVAVGSRGGCR